MSGSAHSDVLRRKTRAGTGPRGRHSAEEIVKRLVPRLVEEDFGVEARLASLQQRELQLSAALDGAEGTPLMIGFGPRGTPPRAVAIADAGLVAAVIEMETTRAVSTIRRDARPPTPVDVALVGGSIRRWVAAMRDAVSPSFLPDADEMRPFVDRRAVLLAFDDEPARVLSFDFDFGDGRRAGVLTVAVPLVRAVPSMTGRDPGIVDRIRGVEAPVHAVLCREAIPLSRLQALETGDLITFERATLRHITLEAPLGAVICTARLGQSKGQRAVRLLGPDSDATEPPAAGTPEAEPAAAPGSAGALDAGAAVSRAEEPTPPATPGPAEDLRPLNSPGGGGDPVQSLPPLQDADLPPLPADVLPDGPRPLPPL